MNRLLCILLVSLLQVTASVAATFNLNVEVTPYGSGSLNTSGGTYQEGASIYLRTYNNTGYVFKGWFEGEELVSSATGFNYTMPQRDVRLQAKYEFDPSVPGNPSMPDTTTYYKLTATVSPHGAGTLNIYEGRYAYNAKASLRAYENTGYRFLAWQDAEGATLSTSKYFDYAMPRHDSQLTALYEFDPSVPANPDSMATNYTVYVKCKPVGGGSFNNSAFTQGEGSSVRIYAYTNTGYTFIHWENEAGEVISTEQNFYYVIPHKDTTVYGVFEFDPAVPGNPNKNYWDKELGELILDDFTPGNLNSAASSAINGSSNNDVTMIIVAGKMNNNDFGIANNYKNCTLLDLSRVSGVTEVPSYAFDGTNLETVYLPATIENIGYRAFENCKQLVALTLYAMTPPTLGENVFRGIPEGLFVYVPAASIAQYQEAAGWKDFTILPIQEDIRTISVSLPEGYAAADFSGMWLELTNTKNGQRLHYVMTDRQQYTFPNIIRNTTWNIKLRNERGDVFGQIDNVEVKDEDVSVTFDSILKPQTVALVVLAPDDRDVTNQTQITWLDAEGNYLVQGATVSAMCAGKTLYYRIALPQDLATAYLTPLQTEYKVLENANNIVCNLEAIPQVALSGKVLDVSTRGPLNGAVVSASQTFAGKYSKTASAKTDAEGNYTLTVFNVPTSLSVALSDYISQTIVCDTLMDGSSQVKIKDIALKPITGATISINLTYRPSVAEGEEVEVQQWYSDNSNVSYKIYNKTKERAISQFNVQYPRIVLLEEVDENDELELTATSSTSSFVPVNATAKIDAEQHAAATFDIVALGGINAQYQKTENAAVVGSLYDNKGKLVKSYDYANAELTVKDLADGNYTLVSMGASSFFNNVYDLAGLPQTGLVEDKDYVKHAFVVKSGVITVVDIEEVPFFDESQFYYTGDNTSFTVNKQSIVAGNYLTLTARIDFKQAYATSVSNLNLIVDLPESCQFVENSVMVGNSTSSYALDGNRLTIPMIRYTDRVRFCVIPTLGGDYAPSAMADFMLDGKQKTQPIGNANFTVKDLEIKVPTIVAKTTLTVSGSATGNSYVEIFENNILVGNTTAKANGMWSTDIEFVDQKNLVTHEIYAKVTRKDGLELQTDKQTCLYDKNAIEVSKVTMINTAHPAGTLNTCEYITEFDFINPKTSIPAYWYWPNYPKFTFIVDFTNNDPLKVSNVELYVFTSNGGFERLRPSFDERIGKWVISKDFNSDNLPVNTSVNFNSDITIDDSIVESYIELAQNQETISEIEMLEYNNSSDMDFAGIFKLEESEIDLNIAIIPITDISEVKGDSIKVNENILYVIDEGEDYTDLYVNIEYIKTLYSSSDEFPQDFKLLETIDNQYIKLSFDAKDSEIANESKIQRPNSSPSLPGTSFYAAMTYRRFFKFSREAQERFLQLERLYKRIERLVCMDDEMKKELYNAIEKLWQQYFRLDLTAKLLGCSKAKITSPLYAVNFAGTTLDFAAKIGFALRCLDIDHFISGYERTCPPTLDPPLPINPDVPHVMDPSGYVYEAVHTNRLEGVTATAYYKETVEDMYGDLHDNIVKWDAEEYAQENPLFTDEYGMYAWDVPQGLWQVKFEKEGYETTYSEWLPVPPPQLEVNIPMKQNIQPNVKAAHAYEDAVELEFDKYMQPELLTTDNIIVQADGQTITGSVQLLNEEVSYEGRSETYASKIRFNAAEPFTAAEVSLRVSNRVKSYAGVRMQDDYMQTFTIEKELNKIVCDSTMNVIYGDTIEIQIAVMPAEASAGKKLTVNTSSSMILALEDAEAVINDNGMAYVTVIGGLPGTSALTYTVEDSKLQATTIVNVVTKESVTVATPEADIVSGTDVEKGTKLSLSCDTEDAVIYYTTDGSCPCDLETATLYVEPIVITEDVTIKAIAIKEGMFDSEIAEFDYTITSDAALESIGIDDELKVYPTLVRDRLTVSVGDKIINRVAIISLNGALAASVNKSANEIHMDVSALAPGIYIVCVSTSDKAYYRKVLKVE